MKPSLYSVGTLANGIKQILFVLITFCLVALGLGNADAQTLTNGANHDGTITINGTNTYTFSATNGESVILRCGELTGSASFAPWIRLYGPTAALLVSDSGVSDAYIAYRATNAGTFTVTVTTTGSGQSGTYRLRFFKIPGTFIVPAGDTGGSLTNGANHDGVTDLGDEDAWTFTATNKDSIILRCGELSGAGVNQYYPYIRLYGPDGALLSADQHPTDSYISIRATNSGTFTVVVGSYYTGDNGSYRLRFVQIPGTFTIPSGDNGGLLTNGANHDGVTDLGDEDTWTFAATNKDSIILRCGELSGAGPNQYYPYIRLYGPDGALLSSDQHPTDSYITLRATNSGNFTVVVGSYYSGDNGSYRLRFVKIPGTFTIPSGDNGGALTNGANHDGVTDLGDEDTWTFTATNKDSIILRCGELSGAGPNQYYPYIRLYGPDGALLSADQHATDSIISYRATNSGTFTVVVGSYYSGDNGSYRLRFFQIPGAFTVPPGDDGGSLTNGANHDGITDLGDEDIWTFAATNKDSVILRCGELSGTGPFDYYPYLRLYGPDGALLVSDYHATDSIISYRATNTGTFTVIVGSAYQGDTGSYRLRYVRIPSAFVVPSGDDGGSLTNGANQDGITDLGDEDIWTFTATNKDSFIVRCGELSGAGPFDYYPYLRLYGPDGALLDSDYNATDSYISYRATNTGTFTVVVGSAYQGDTGSYRLRLVRIPGAFVVPPGDDGGSLSNGANHDGTTDLGDEDIWTFTANNKENIIVRCGELSGSGPNQYYPYLRLYGPDGALLDSDYNPTDSYLAYLTTNSGTFTVVVGSAYRGDIGIYRLSLSKIPGSFVVSPGDQGGSLTNSADHDGEISLGDQDLWRFTVCRGDRIVLNCAELTDAGSFSPWIQLYGPDGAYLINHAAGSLATISYTATNRGNFTVVVSSYVRGGTGTYRLTGNGLSDGLKLCLPVVFGTNVNLSAVGGPSNAVYILSSTTNAGALPATWTPLRTNNLDQYGTFVMTNVLDRQRYFRLRLP